MIRISLFPSPAGSSYFSIQHDHMGCHQLPRFRPLRGLRISQFKEGGKVDGYKVVSVPCGVFVFLNKTPESEQQDRSCFRPLRGLRISQYNITKGRCFQECFRPLRGLRISQYLQSYEFTDEDSFRPLRGLRISQYIIRIAERLNVPFPSPAGSSYFSMEGWAKITNTKDAFPSPAGSSYFSICKVVYRKQKFRVSVPCGVFVFLNKGLGTVHNRSHEFPSPAGSSYFSML